MKLKVFNSTNGYFQVVGEFNLLDMAENFYEGSSNQSEFAVEAFLSYWLLRYGAA